jgi:carbon monoxide dehydrogenase subunit G
MSTQSLTLQRTVHAPVEQVWAVLTDLDHAVERLSGVTRVELLTDGPYAVGTRWRETRRVFGAEATEEMWVAANDPLRSTVVEASSRGADYRTTFTLTPVEPGTTLLAMEFSADAPEGSGVRRLVSRLVSRLGERASRRMMERDLEDIAAAALATGPGSATADPS